MLLRRGFRKPKKDFFPGKVPDSVEEEGNRCWGRFEIRWAEWAFLGRDFGLGLEQICIV
jgi:hypothetical protein